MSFLVAAWLATVSVADIERPIEELSECQFETRSDRSGWREVSDRTARLILPEPFTAAEPGFSLHGSKRWTDEKSSVSVSWGYWGRISFYETEATFCRLTCGAATMVVADVTSEDKSEERVVYVLFGEPMESSGHEPLIEVSTPIEDLSIAQGVILGTCALRAAEADDDLGRSSSPADGPTAPGSTR